MWRPKNCEALIESLFTRLLAALFGYAIVAARGWPFSAAMFPIIVGLPGYFLAGALALRIALRGEDNPKESGTGRARLEIYTSMRSFSEGKA